MGRRITDSPKRRKLSPAEVRQAVDEATRFLQARAHQNGPAARNKGSSSRLPALMSRKG
jgi:hypothetical protein